MRLFTCVRHDVGFKGIPAAEGGIANFALERSDIKVPFQMITQMPIGFEFFATSLVRAFIWLFPCVVSVVDFQVALFVEGSAAFFTCERFVSSLNV